VILGIGTDIVQVDRFESWLDYPQERLLKIFSPFELQECLAANHSDIVCQKLASRFATKEAFYKALNASIITLGYSHSPFSLLFSCRHACVVKASNASPQLQVDWRAFENKIKLKLPQLSVHLSFSHEKKHALSFVVIEGK
jgi:phosphopantetheine--protein transferase-like protein